MTGREPNPNSDQGGARRETDLAVVVLASAFSPRSQAALRSTRAILRSQVACGAINGVIAAIGTIIATSRPEIQLQAHFFRLALGNGELVATAKLGKRRSKRPQSGNSYVLLLICAKPGNDYFFSRVSAKAFLFFIFRGA